MTNIYYIGGSPCSGKSTITEILSKKYGLYYFKVDDFLDKYAETGASKGYPICKKQIEMDAEQIWMREPTLQCKEELLFYEEILEFILEDLRQIGNTSRIITEGAAYLPKLMMASGVPAYSYLSITPSREFQIFHYSKREFVPYILEGCRDPEKAFCNWMERDVLFAQEVRRQCHEEKYLSIINDGSLKIEELTEKAVVHFGLNV